jgi:hypothetical protein
MQHFWALFTRFSLLFLSFSISREFSSAFEVNVINITDTNFPELHRLCEEFDFFEVAAKLSEFRSSMNSKEREAERESESKAAEVDAKANQQFHVIPLLQDKVTQLFTDFGRLVCEVSALRCASAGIRTHSEESFALKRQKDRN